MHICHISIYFLYVCKKNGNVEKLYVNYLIQVFNISAALIIMIVETCIMMMSLRCWNSAAHSATVYVWLPRGLQFSERYSCCMDRLTHVQTMRREHEKRGELMSGLTYIVGAAGQSS